MRSSDTAQSDCIPLITIKHQADFHQSFLGSISRAHASMQREGPIPIHAVQLGLGVN